ncbi:hypothetical protein KP509_33G067600 [Ceratopteris richardii]|uniref:Uncharacterized protein n=1 Tax=Ceratopteris richardii TaxID=49495 RepID=A0A8T2QQP9_CERRI|nr:hypothetical protein KP509_33G067600 [Ceratopteris richardii]
MHPLVYHFFSVRLSSLYRELSRSRPHRLNFAAHTSVFACFGQPMRTFDLEWTFLPLLVMSINYEESFVSSSRDYCSWTPRHEGTKKRRKTEVH